MKQSRSLGQVFLTDQKYIRKIAGALDVAGRTVVEIGSGPGQMTGLLASQAGSLYCLELDPRFCDLLRRRFSGQANVKIVCGDALRFSLAALGEAPVVFGNAPYQISNELLRYLVANRSRISKVYLTLQKEFVNKLSAGVSAEGYGFLSCYIQYYARVEKLFDIPRRAFSPVPRVDSSFMTMVFRPEPAGPRSEYILRLIRRAFSSRRKKLINTLPELKQRGDILESLNIPVQARPENVSLEQYISLARIISPE